MLPSQVSSSPGGGLNLESDKLRGVTKKDEYLSMWQQQIKDKEDNKKREREERHRRERIELEADMNYNPFGKDDKKKQQAKE